LGKQESVASLPIEVIGVLFYLTKITIITRDN